jgi:hypothetical protein
VARKNRPPKEPKVKKVKEKKPKKERPAKKRRQKKETLLSDKKEKKTKGKLIKIGLPILLVILILAGAAFFILKSGMLSGGVKTSDNEAELAEKQSRYSQAQTYYKQGDYYDASAMFILLGDYEDSKAMAEKIKLASSYPAKGAGISEYIGCDVVNNYIACYKNYAEIEKALGVTETTSQTDATNSADATTNTTTEEDSKNTETTKKSEEKIQYDESTIATVTEKTNELMDAGNLVKCLNLPADHFMYGAHESLKRSADYGNQAAWKIQEGVKDGTYKPNGDTEVSTEVKTLLENMKSENDAFLQEVDTLLSANLLDMIGYSNTGACMKRYSATIGAFYK